MFDKAKFVSSLNPANAPTWVVVLIAIFTAIIIGFIIWNIWNLHIAPVRRIMKVEGLDRKSAKAKYDKETQEYIKKLTEIKKESNSNDVTK